MEAADTKQYIIIMLNNEHYGIEIKYIENIIVMQNITRVPKAQLFFKGVINLRGEIIPVLSLRSKLGQEEAAFTAATRIVIVRPDQQAAPVGIIVDEVNEVITLENAQVEKMTYDEKDESANYSVGIGKVEGDLVNLLNIPSIILEKETIL